MFRNFLKLTFRQLAKQKVFTLINILGLTIGLVSCILIGLFITSELGYDSFPPKRDRIVRMTMEYGANGQATQTAVTGSKAGPELQRSFPEVERFVRMVNSGVSISYGEKLFRERRFLYADTAFLSV